MSMLWTGVHWEDLRKRMYASARKAGASHEDAEDMSQQAALEFMERWEKARDRNKYPWGILRNLKAKPRNGRHKREVIIEDANVFRRDEVAPLGVNAGALQWMFLATTIRQVLHFGPLQERGRVSLLLRESRIDPSSAIMQLTYLAKLLDEAPVDHHTRNSARERFQRLFEKALDRVQVDTETVHGVENPMNSGTMGWREDKNGNRRELSGNASEGLELMRLLFPRLPEPVAMDHAEAVEEEVWAGRDRGVSVWAFKIEDDPQEDEDVREVSEQLKELWKWPHGGELRVTAETVTGDVAVRVFADDRVLYLDVPTGEMCFGQPLSSDAVQLLKDLGYDPPDEESDCYHMDLDIRNRDHNEDVVEFVFETLETVYGWDPDDPFAWACEFCGPDEEDEAA